MSEERELYEIRHLLECMVPIMERIATALEKLAPKGSEREPIALKFFTAGDFASAESFDIADAWVQERDKQRAQVEQGRAE